MISQEIKDSFDGSVVDNIEDQAWVGLQDDLSVGLDGCFTIEDLTMIVEKLKALKDLTNEKAQN